jgi:hypothetical protein
MAAHYRCLCGVVTFEVVRDFDLASFFFSGVCLFFVFLFFFFSSFFLLESPLPLPVWVMKSDLHVILLAEAKGFYR